MPLIIKYFVLFVPLLENLSLTLVPPSSRDGTSCTSIIHSFVSLQYVSKHMHSLIRVNLILSPQNAAVVCQNE